jgi:hypothetical protein
MPFLFTLGRRAIIRRPPGQAARRRRRSNQCMSQSDAFACGSKVR